MKVLVINAGSSSLKYQLIDMDNEQMIAKGLCERIGTEGSLMKGSGRDGKGFKFESPMPTHVESINLVLNMLTDKEFGVLNNMNEIDAIGHRVVHSGPDFTASAVITDETLALIVKNTELAPLHQPANIAGIEACIAAMPGKTNVAVFDTAFHSTIPLHASLYGLPYEAYTEWNIKKYGFHGTSHKFVSEEVAKFLGKDYKNMKIINCHLGNGSSISAVNNGVCVETSMGLTPLEGVPMGTRCGDIDPSCIEFIMKKSGMNISETMNYLNKKSGMLGISGTSSDFRDLCEGYDKGDLRCTLAIDIFSYRVKKYIASYAGIMGGVDAIVFTGGVGENTAVVREKALDTLGFMGIEMDDALNNLYKDGQVYKYGPSVCSSENSKVKIVILPTNEELVIARDTKILAK